MKLKTKMTLLFLTIIFVPLLFFAAAFLGIGYHENVNVIHELTKEDVMIGAMISKRFMGTCHGGDSDSDQCIDHSLGKSGYL